MNLNAVNILEKNLLQSLLAYDYFYKYIIDLFNYYIIPNETLSSVKNNFIEKLLSNKDVNSKNFIDNCISIISNNENILDTEKSVNSQYSFENEDDSSKFSEIVKSVRLIFEILKIIYMNYDEKIFLVITKLCENIKSEGLLMEILIYINPMYIDIYPGRNNLTCVDYLILNNKINCLEYLIERINYIYFINSDENAVFLLIDRYMNKYNNSIDKDVQQKIIKFVFMILKKSNISKLRDILNRNIIYILLEKFKINYKLLNEYIKYFDIFEQDVNGNNLYEIILQKYNDKTVKKILPDIYTIDSQLKYTKSSVNVKKINYNFSVKNIIKYSAYGLFNSDHLHNVIYTLYMLKKYKILKIPYISKIDTTEYNEKYKMLIFSNNDSDIHNLLEFYFYNFYQLLTHLIIWKNKNNYYIDNHLLEWLKSDKNSSRFVYIKLSIIGFENIGDDIRHANIILIDNFKKIVERFEPYGKILYNDSLDLNNMIIRTICKPLDYQFIFRVDYPGFQARSNELDIYSRSYGDPGGFCVAWCYLYIETKMKYYKLEDKYDTSIVTLLNNYIINRFSIDYKNGNDNNYMTFIRYFAKKLDNEKNSIIKKYKLESEIIYSTNIKNQYYKKIIRKLNDDILKLCY
jgi:hypothetical protein